MSSDPRLQLVFAAKNLADQELGRLRGGLSRLGRSAHGLRGPLRSAAGGIAHLGKLAALAAAAGIGAVIAGIGLVTKAAADEEVGVRRLSAALKANTKHHAGQSAAIDRAINKAEALAFADDEVRDSLSLLLPRTKSLGQALKIQSVAQDVARLRGIGLVKASDMVSKAMQGNQKILKQLGIELPKNATKTQILAAIQKKAAGQAAEYGKSGKGSFEAFKVAMDNLIEDVGADFLPMMGTLFTALRVQVLPVVRQVIANIKQWVADNRPLIDQIAAFVGGTLTTLASFITGTVVPAIATVAGRIGDWVAQNQPLISSIRDGIVKFVGLAVEKIGALVGWIASFVGSITSNQDVMNVLGTIFQAIGDAVGIVFDLLGKVIQLIADVVAAITSNKTIMDGFAAAWDIIAGAVGGVVDVLKTVIGWVGDAITAIDKLLGKQGQVGSNLGPIDTSKGTFGAGGHAKGGWAGLHGPELSWLGEKGPEYVVPNHELGRFGMPSRPGFSMASSPAAAPRGQRGSPGVRIEGVSERQLTDIIERGLYVRLRRAGVG